MYIHIQAPHITTATALAIATITLYKLAPEPFLKNRTEVCSFFFLLGFAFSNSRSLFLLESEILWLMLLTTAVVDDVVVGAV